MKRFSQKNNLVTLSDINITPLLDLAFVLLIIFIISTPLLEHSIKLDLPSGGEPDQELTRQDIRVVEIDRQGRLSFSGRPVGLPLMEQWLIQLRGNNPRLSVRIYADEYSQTGNLVEVMDLCSRLDIPINVATDPKPQER